MPFPRVFSSHNFHRTLKVDLRHHLFSEVPTVLPRVSHNSQSITYTEWFVVLITIGLLLLGQEPSQLHFSQPSLLILTDIKVWEWWSRKLASQILHLVNFPSPVLPQFISRDLCEHRGCIPGELFRVHLLSLDWELLEGRHHTWIVFKISVPPVL